MKHYQRNGINFLTDLVWQKLIPGEKISLKKYRENCKFDFFCKVSKLSTYGFGRWSRDNDGKIIFKPKKPVSLGMYIIDAIEIDAEKDVSLFVCFCFDNNATAPVYGYVFLYDGTFLPEEGEYLGSLDEVKAKIRNLSKQYNAKIAFVPDDVPFYNDLSFENETGLEIRKLESTIDEKTGEIILASERYFWSKATPRRLRSCAIRTLDTKKQKRLLIALASLSIVSLLGIGAKAIFYPDISTDDLELVAKPTAYPAQIFINNCLANLNTLVIDNANWQTVSYKCTVQGIQLVYKQSTSGQLLELERLIGHKVIKSQNGAVLDLSIQLPEDPKLNIINFKSVEFLDKLQNLGEKLGLTINAVNNKVNITSSYSPIFLYNSGIINQLNLSEISAVPDGNAGFLNWTITGDINDK